MATKYYVNASNDYLGGFDGNTGKVPANAIEVPTPPPDARAKWIPASSTWGPVNLTVAEKLGPEVQKQMINLTQGICDFVIRGDKTILTQIDNKLTQLKNS
jgi:hypothetical protein